MIIAIDGPAASGKGTLARRLAAEFGLKHLDTGRTYRAVAAILIAREAASDDTQAAVAAAADLDFDAIPGMDLSSDTLGEAASRIAVLPPLRAALVERQRAFAESAQEDGFGAVLDGRDIGTVVLPHAHVKLFVTADVETRARRRALELFGESSGPHYDKIVETLRARDRRDTQRAVAPLAAAPDAVVLDTSAMDPDAAFHAAVGLVEKIRSA